MGVATLSRWVALVIAAGPSSSVHTRPARAQSARLTFRGVAEESGEVGSETIAALRGLTEPLSACADGATDLVARLRYARSSEGPRVQWVEGSRRARACAGRLLRRVEAARPRSSTLVVWWSSRGPSAPPVILRSSGQRLRGPGEGFSRSRRSFSLHVQGADAWEAPHAAWLQRHSAVWTTCVTRHDEGRTVRVTFDRAGRASATVAFSISRPEGQALGACVRQHLSALPPAPPLALQVWSFTIGDVEGASELVQP